VWTTPIQRHAPHSTHNCKCKTSNTGNYVNAIGECGVSPLWDDVTYHSNCWAEECGFCWLCGNTHSYCHELHCDPYYDRAWFQATDCTPGYRL
jgi:hypothetical protein